MATTIQVIPHLSPRIIKILAPVTIISVQELTDQIKDWEDEPSNLSYPVLVKTSGKESLGGGVSVGITAELQNAKVMFEARTGSDAHGTITSGDNSNTILIDDNANFSNINPGDSIVNWDTGAVATILSVDSTTQVTHEPLGDGIVNTWIYGDQYKIWNKIQCEINGGNLVAVDTNGDDISPFLPSAFTHVIRTSASSATLQEQEDIQFSAFDGAIHLDAINGTSGTTFPAGTPRQPVDNLADALTVSTIRGIDQINVIGNFTFVSGDDVSGKEVVGEDPSKSTLTFELGAATALTQFRDCTIQGAMTRPSGFRDCRILSFTGNLGGTPSTGTVFIIECIVSGTISVDTDLEGSFQLIDCSSGVEDAIFDMNDAAATLVVRKFTGHLQLQNFTSVYTSAEIDMISGNVVIDSSNTDGTIELRGISLLADDSNGSTIDTSGLIFADELQLSAFNEKVTVDITRGVAGTQFPIGTKADPVNNITDAIAIANTRGIQTLFIVGTITLDTGDVLTDFTLEGQNPNQTTIIVNTGAQTDRVEYTNCTLTGILDGGSIVRNSTVFDLSFFNGILISCLINPGTIALGGGVTAHILDCSSGVPGATTPIIDMGGSGQSLGIRGYNGGIKLINKTGPESASIDMNSGQVILDSTITGGTIVVRGVAFFTNNITSLSPDINLSGLVFADQSQLASFSEKVTIDILSGTSGIIFPCGTAQIPVNSLADAITIANSRGISTLSIVGNLTITYSDDISGFTILGESLSFTKITLEAGCITDQTIFRSCTLVGVVNGPIEASSCELAESDEDLTGLGSLTDTATVFTECILHNMKLTSLAVGQILLLDCNSADTGGANTIFDHNNSTSPIGFRNYSGGLTFRNMSDIYGQYSVELISGFLLIENTCTEGTMVVRGTAVITDNSGPNFTLDTTGVSALGDDRSQFNDEVHINIDDGSSGTTTPIGTAFDPVNNITDARAIAERIGARKYVIEGTIVLESSHTNWLFKGIHGDADEIVDVYGHDVSGSSFTNIKIQGAIGGTALNVVNCVLDNITNFSGSVTSGTILDTISIAETAAPTLFFDVAAGGSTNSVTIDTGGGGRIIAGVNLTGNWIVDNMSPGPPFPPTIVSLEFASGEVTLNASNTGGNVELAGLANLTDNSGVGTTVDSANLLQPSAQGGGAEAWDELITDHETPNTFGKKLIDILKLKRTQP